MRSLTLILLCWFTQTLFAGDYCGTRSNKLEQTLIPDNFNASLACPGLNITQGTADFFKACKEHDICYWQLGADRGVCDRDFKAQLIDQCKRAYKTAIDQAARLCCEGAANGYAAAVRSAGLDAFNEGQAQAKTAVEQITSQTNYQASKTIIDLVASRCFAFNEDLCPTNKVAEEILQRLSTTKAIFNNLVDIDLSETFHNTLLGTIYNSGSKAVEMITIQTFPREVVDKMLKTYYISLSDQDRDSLANFLVNFGLNQLKEEIFIRHRTDIIKDMYRAITNTNIPFHWQMYFERRLTSVKDIESIRKEMIEKFQR